jgi:hypothetical protein
VRGSGMPRTLEEIGLKPNERAALAELALRLREHFGRRLAKVAEDVGDETSRGKGT